MPVTLHKTVDIAGVPFLFLLAEHGQNIFFNFMAFFGSRPGFFLWPGSRRRNRGNRFCCLSENRRQGTATYTKARKPATLHGVQSKTIGTNFHCLFFLGRCATCKCLFGKELQRILPPVGLFLQQFGEVPGGSKPGFTFFPACKK